MNRIEPKPSSDQEFMVRQIFDPPAITADCDNNLWSEHFRGSSGPPRFTKTSGTHIFLAACGVNQSAVETANGGLFTTQLLRILENTNLNELSYSSLMHRLTMPAWLAFMVHEMYHVLTISV